MEEVALAPPMFTVPHDDMLLLVSSNGEGPFSGLASIENFEPPMSAVCREEEEQFGLEPRGVRWNDDQVASVHKINQSLPADVHLSRQLPSTNSCSEGEGLSACGMLLMLPLMLASLLPVGVAAVCTFGL